MKQKHIFIVVFFTLFFSFLPASTQESKKNRSNWPVLKGPYLGQNPPGMKPEIFAPGIISTEKKELNSVFSPKGDEFYFAISTSTREEEKNGKYFYIIMVTRQIDGVWLKPKMASFSGKYSTVDMSFTSDGKRLYFCSDRPTPWNTSPNRDIWYCDRLAQGWSEPKNPGTPVNSPGDEVYPTFTANRTMYFSSSRQGGQGKKDLYYARLKNGKYTRAINLGDVVNSPYGEGDTFVSPDESYLLISCWGRPNIPRGRGLFISFKKKDNSWTRPSNIELTTKINGGCPMLSPDEKYLFFTKNNDIYWVDAKVIEALKPKELK
jgi:hypothetical protein